MSPDWASQAPQSAWGPALHEEWLSKLTWSRPAAYLTSRFMCTTHGGDVSPLLYATPPQARGGGGGDPSVLDANYPPQLTVGRRHPGGGGGLREGQWGGGVQVGRFGVLGGGGAQAPLTSTCPPSNHIITINLTLTLAAS